MEGGGENEEEWRGEGGWCDMGEGREEDVTWGRGG